jgi:hypothetical protein
MKTVSIKIGVSGKREILPEEKEKVYKEIKSRIKSLLRQFRVEGFVGYTSLASGADTIFAAVVVDEFKQPLHVILPFPKEEYEKDFEVEDLDAFRLRLGQATECEVVGGVPADAGKRNEAYFGAGRRVADSCDEMVFVWDGLRPGGLGGTADILGYWAEKKKEYPVPYIKVRAFKADLVQDELVHGYARSNRIAIRARNRYRQVWVWVIRLGWLTVGCFAVKTAYAPSEQWSKALTLLEFLCVLAVYLLIFLARKRNYHGNYLRERMKAETYRLMRVFYHGNVQMGISDRSREGDKSIGELAESINRRIDGDEVRSPWYSQYVIRCLVTEQCAYHEDKMKSIGNRNQIYEQANLLIGILFILNLAIHLTLMFVIRRGLEDMWQYKIGIFLNLLLPSTYAALEGIMYFNEWAVLKKYSTSADSSLREASGLLPAELDRVGAQESYKIQAQVLHLVSGVMLTDNRNWNLLLENKETYRMII